MTIPPVRHPFIASPNPRFTHCARCGLAKQHPIHTPTSTDDHDHGETTTSDKEGW